jgi:SpoIID/LytB domain protein
VTTARASTDFAHMARGHALVLTCVCVAILSLNFASPRHNWAPFDWRSETTQPNEDAVDAVLKQAAITALGQRDGAIIVMDPQTGRVRAMVNPRLLFAQAVMPGSTMKSFTALAALRAGLIDANSRTVCPGRFTGISFSLPCVHADHLPPFTPSQAIAYSCNYYFATLGRRLGRDRLVETLRPFGFGQPTGISEAEEPAGTLRPCETGNSARIRTTQSDCDARAAIGESDHIQATPIQLLSAYAALVNGGHLFQPHVASTNGFDPVERNLINIAPAHRTIITEGMRGAVRYGTAKRANLDSLPVSIIGKTGTSLPPKGFRTNGWFVGFAAPLRKTVSDSTAPDGEPAPNEIDLAVLVFLTRSHGADAAALAKPIFEAFANETISVHRGDAEQRSGSAEMKASNLQSAIKVHLVHDNVTQELSLEDYVLGVMRAEGSMETEPEALKALAIAIRTYALTNRGRHAKDGYDFCSTTHCQRFLPGNVSSQTVREGSAADQALPDGRATDTMIQAVRATEGQVLLAERGRLADAYFSASCGGETANIGTLWGVSPPGYLRGVRDEFCVNGPHASWTDLIKRADLLRALRSESRTDVGSRLDNIVVSKRDETGRAEFITLEGEHRKTVRGWDFKIIVGRVLGWNLLKSSRFQVARSGSDFIFRGSGFGHGLGLCQEGAHVMAARGISYRQILSKYFPGTSVGRGNRVATNLSGDEPFELTAECAEAHAEIAETNLCVPLRNPLRPLRLNASFSDHPSQAWKADVLLSTPTSLRVAASPGPKFYTISSEHFRVTCPASVDRRDANLVLNTLETAHADFLRRASAASISVPGIPTLEIRLNDSTGDFTSRTGQPWWAAAATRGNRIELQPVGVLKRRGVLTTTLRHELAHVLIDTVSHDRAPRWLEEGFAIYLAGEGAIISRYATKARMTTDELERRLERPGSQQEMRALYSAAYREVTSLIQRQGESGVWRRLAESR